MNGGKIMSTIKRVVVLGAGYGGIEAALDIHRHSKRRDDISITIIDKNQYHTLLTELHEVAGNRVTPDGLMINLHKIFEHTKVNVVIDEIKSIDFDAQVLKSETKSYCYDYLVMATGSEPTYFGIPGMAEHSLTLWSMEDALRINNHIKDVFDRAANEKDPKERKKLLTIVVGGGGFTGIETVGELIQWADELCKKHKIARNEVNLYVIEALDRILPNLPDSLIKKATAFLQKKGVKVLTSSPIIEVTADSLTLKSGETIKTKTLIWNGGVQANSFAANVGLKTNRRGRLEVNEFMQSVDYPNVYAIGDNCYFDQDNNGSPMPALVESALQSGKCAAHNILADINGKDKKRMKLNLHGVMVSIGSRYAVAKVSGLPQLSGYLATALKHMVNMHYLFGIGGIAILAEYINHQLLHNLRKPSLLGPHFTAKSANFWLVPLRLYLGYMWIMSGLDKINSGWLQYEMLAGTANATSGASMMQLVSDHTPGWYAWIVDTIIVPYAMLFQKLIIATEVGIGLALIAGLFTLIAAAVGVAMNINFILSTGLNDYWFLAASIACMGGAGRAFGLDHYVIPYLQRMSKRWWHNR
jgi:NADH dehydrogenase